MNITSYQILPQRPNDWMWAWKRQQRWDEYFFNKPINDIKHYAFLFAGTPLERGEEEIQKNSWP